MRKGLPLDKSRAYILYYEDEDLWQEVKVLAAKRRSTIKELIIEGLNMVLQEENEKK